MRSNDVMLGMPYDIFLFTMLQEMAATTLKCEMGAYHHQVGSLHLYEHQFGMAREILKAKPTIFDSMAPMMTVDGVDSFLAGEESCRSGRCWPNSSDQTGYWMDLLEVITSWSRIHLNRSAGESPVLRDPVLRALFHQWFATRRLNSAGLSAGS